MAIVKMSRFSLLTFKENQAELLLALQAMGDVHFSDLTIEAKKTAALSSAGPGERADALSDILVRIQDGIDTMSEFRSGLKGLQTLNSALPEIDFAGLQSRSKTLHLKTVSARLDILKKEIAQAAAAARNARMENSLYARYRKLNVPLAKIREMTGTKAFVGSLPKRWHANLQQLLEELDLTVCEQLATDEQSAYIFVMSELSEADRAADALRANGFVEADLKSDLTPQAVIDANRSQITRAEEQADRARQELKELAERYLDDFMLLHEALANEALRENAQALFVDTDTMLIIGGYVPTERDSELESIIKAVCANTAEYSITPLDRDDDDLEDIPIRLQNNAVVRPFESIVSTYSLPKYNEVDPTPLMMPWYCISFGMMMGDLGYGLLLLLATTLALKCFRMKQTMVEQIRFFQILSIPTIIAGACFGSFFSFSFPSLFSPTTQYMELLGISVVFGVLMLFMGLGIKGYMSVRDGCPSGLLYDVISWYLLLGGAFAYGAGVMLPVSPIVKTVGTVGMIVGALLIWFFSARDEQNLFARFAWGFYNLYGVSSWVGDIVSYTRIAALALSGAFIGAAVNQIAGGLLHTAIGFLPGLLIAAAFHLFNMFLSGLSGYVHTMRLVYVEFFGKFYEGGGKPFQRFRAPSRYYEVK